MKRRNCSPNTVKNYLNIIKHFVIWVDIPVEGVTHTTVARYIDYLMKKRMAPKTVNCHLDGIRQFYHYLKEEEDFEDEDDEIFECRICGAEFTYLDGDDYILLCDQCAEDYNMDQIWADFDIGKLKEADLKTVDLNQYKYKL